MRRCRVQGQMLGVPGRNRGVLGQKGFTLIEIMIVITIIGMLAAIAFPAYKKVLAHSQNSRFANDAKVAATAFEVYAVENGSYPADEVRGVMPHGMQPYLMKFNWTEETSLGGQWDWDHGQFGVQASVSAAGVTVPQDQLIELDEQIDNGDLNTGIIQVQGDRVLYVLEE